MYKISYNRMFDGIYISTTLKEQVLNGMMTTISNENYMSIDDFKTKYNIDLANYQYFIIEKNDLFNTENNIDYSFGEETENLQINWVSIPKDNAISAQFANIIDTILDDFVQYQMNEYDYKLIDSVWTPDIEKLRTEYLSSEKMKYININNIRVKFNVNDFSISLSKIDYMLIRQSISLNEPFELPIEKNDDILLQEFDVNELQTIINEFEIKFNDFKNEILSNIQEIKTTTDINYFINY